jgi:glycosyltransferase involved in cell wall biosynthesis
MQKKTPDVSVCLCTYHTEEHPTIQWLSGCIQSILAQDGVDLQLIILDNGSGPEVAAILDGIDDPRVIRVRFEKNHQDHAFGTMAEMATGRYTCLFCDDDEMLPGCLEGQVKIMDASGAALAAPTNLGDDELNFATLFIRCFIPVSGTLFRSTFNHLVRQEMTSIEGDWALWLAIAAQGSIIRVPVGRINQRIHEGSDTSMNGFGAGKFVEDHIRIWKSWIINRGYVPSEIQLWSMVHHFQWFLQRTKCSEEKKWGYMKELRRLLFGIA